MITILETPISKLSAEQSQVFLDYFLSKLCAKHDTILHTPSSAGIIQQNKWYITIEDYLLDKEGKKIKVEWKIIQEHDKTISLVQVLAHLDNSDDHTINQANEFLNEILFAVISVSKSKYFHRFYFSYINQHNLGGVLNVNKHLRIAPLFPDDNDGYVNAERILVIDQNVHAIDKRHSYQVAEEQANVLASVLSLILDIDLCKPTDHERYSRTNSNTNKRVLLGFKDLARPMSMPLKNKTYKPTQPPQSIHEFLRRSISNNQFSYPKETRKILQCLLKSNNERNQAFIKCCQLYHLGLKMSENHPTAKIAYMYGAVDSLAKNLNIVNGSFSAFMRKYNPDVNGELLDFIHEKIRSSHWHNGNSILGDYNSSFRMLFCDQEAYNNYQYSRSCHMEIRKSILKWLFDEIIKPCDSKTVDPAQYSTN